VSARSHDRHNPAWRKRCRTTSSLVSRNVLVGCSRSTQWRAGLSSPRGETWARGAQRCPGRRGSGNREGGRSRGALLDRSRHRFASDRSVRVRPHVRLILAQVPYRKPVWPVNEQRVDRIPCRGESGFAAVSWGSTSCAARSRPIWQQKTSVRCPASPPVAGGQAGSMLPSMPSRCSPCERAIPLTRGEGGRRRGYVVRSRPWRAGRVTHAWPDGSGTPDPYREWR